MSPPMRWILTALGVAALCIAAVYIAGISTARTHRASIEVTYAAAPDTVYSRIRDVARGAGWRTGLERVDVLSAAGQPMRWRETADWGTLTFEHVVDEPPRRIAARIVDDGQGFGGRWTYDLTPNGSGTRLVITEDGRIDDPLYRFVARWMMGYHASLETYARDLGRSLGEQVEPRRVE